MSPKFILHVEDNSDDVALTQRAFKKNGFNGQLVVLNDGAAAIEYLLGPWGDEAEPRPIPAVVLLDLKLPKVDGLEVLQRIRSNERTRHVPVVILSSSSEEKDVRRSYELGANSYVRKPVDFDALSTALIALARYWLSLNELPP